MKKEDSPVPRVRWKIPPELVGQANQVRMVCENLQQIGGRKVSYTEPKPLAPPSLRVVATVNISAGLGWSPWQATIDCAGGKVQTWFMGRPISEQKLAEVIAILVRKDG